MHPTKRELKFVWALIGVMLCASGLLGQAPAKYEPTHEQHLELEVAQKDAVIAQQQLQMVQNAYQAALDRLHAEAARIRAAQKWPDTVQFNDQTLTFAEPPKPAEPAKK